MRQLIWLLPYWEPHFDSKTAKNTATDAAVAVLNTAFWLKIGEKHGNRCGCSRIENSIMYVDSGKNPGGAKLLAEFYIE